MDLQQVQSDLMVQKACSSITPAKIGDVADGRGNLNDSLWYGRTNDQHYGMICILDVLTMMRETGDPLKLNNVIVSYPVITKSADGTTTINIAYRGASISDDQKTLTFPDAAGHYFSNWCPAMCPATLGNVAKPTPSPGGGGRP